MSEVIDESMLDLTRRTTPPQTEENFAALAELCHCQENAGELLQSVDQTIAVQRSRQIAQEAKQRLFGRQNCKYSFILF